VEEAVGGGDPLRGGQDSARYEAFFEPLRGTGARRDVVARYELALGRECHGVDVDVST
jgi:hypothetical protein